MESPAEDSWAAWEAGASTQWFAKTSEVTWSELSSKGI